MDGSFKRLISEGFRVFFLSAGLFAMLAVLWWILHLGAIAGMGPFAMNPAEWHAHELVFGYGGAALGGFLLTAVPNWTGAKGAPHLFIGAVAVIWLAGRVALWASGILPGWVVATVDLAFLPILWLYKQSILLAPLLPLAGLMYSLMTIDSAIAHWRGRGGAWKGRIQEPAEN